MHTQPTILVIGATGAQGGSVARHLLKTGAFQVRCLTRKPDSPAAAALQNAGAEIVSGDLSDKPSLLAALRGCTGVFGVTNFWEHFGGELQQGRNLIEAVAESSTPNFVLSTLPGYQRISKGTHVVPHCDIKAELEDYARSLKPDTTFVHVGYYFENFLSYFIPKKGEDGAYYFGFPQGDTSLGGVGVEDMGGVVARIFENSEAFRGRVVGIFGDDLPGAAYAEAMTQVLGKTVRYNHFPREVFASFGFPGAEELAAMFDFQRLYVLSRSQEVAESRALYPQIRTFEAWLTDHRERVSAVLG